MIGRLIEGRRERVVLSTKYSTALRTDDPNGGGSHRRHLVEALESSLRRMRTDHVDVLWVHFRDELTPVEETMRALDDQVRLGKVLYVAVSNWPAWEIARANTMAVFRDWTSFPAIQLQYNLLERTPERELIPMASALGLSTTAWSPLARGLLSGKYLDPAATGRLTTAGRKPEMDAHVRSVVSGTVAVADELGATASQVALAWLLARPERVIPILGARTLEQFEENLAALDVSLSGDQVDRLDAVSAVDHGFPHDWLDSDEVRDFFYGPLWRRI